MNREIDWELPAAVLAQEANGAEPHAAKYLHDALAEEDEVLLTSEERAHCVRVVQTAILCLHRACESRQPADRVAAPTI